MFHRSLKLWLAIAVLLGLTFTIAVPTANAQDAQTAAQKERAEKAKALKDREDAELRIDADMQNMSDLVEALSKNLGQLHYLRTLCFGSGDQHWRKRASDMMDVEAKVSAERRSKMIRAFNAGFYQEEARHEDCNQSVSVDVAALSENGRHLASMLADPYR